MLLLMKCGHAVRRDDSYVDKDAWCKRCRKWQLVVKEQETTKRAKKVLDNPNQPDLLSVSKRQGNILRSLVKRLDGEPDASSVAGEEEPPF